MSDANSYYERHVFFCLNERKNGEACCAQHHAQEAFDRCKSLVKSQVVERLLTPPNLGR